MESWSYVCGGGKEVVSSDTISSSDAFARSNNGLVSWDLKGQCSFGNNGPVLGQNGTEFREFGELDYTEHTGDELPDTTIRTALTSNPLIVSANSFALEDDFMSRLPSSAAMDSNGKDSCFIDLKLGRLGDPRDYVTCKGTPIVSSSDSSTPPKRIRVGLNALKVHCQVYGCNKDLSSSKEYHKRHRVCEVHSKTAKVIVNGIEQRFCQQCSRFHLLSEFDDVKRSCRKRLQGHNERRRKPQVGLHSGRAGRLLQSFSGFGSSEFHGRALAHSSFICQDIHPGGLLHPEKFGTNGCSRHIKLEDETTFGVLPAIPLIGSAYSESVNRHPSIMGSLSSGRRPLFQGTSLENEDFTAFDATSTVKGPSEITYSGRAFSLLSPQSSNSSSPSSGIPIARPVVSSGSDPRYCMSQIPEKLMRASSHASDNVYNMSNRFAPDMNSVEGSHLSPILISNHSNGFDTDGLYRGSHLMNNEHHVSSEDSSTINLLQLSSELQRVEHQKQSTQVKQETDAFCCPHIS